MLDPKALADLGFGALTEALAASAATPMGRARCRALPLLSDRAEVELHLDEIDQARILLHSDSPPPFDGLSDLDGPLQRAEKQGALDGPSLAAVATFARACSRLRGYLEDRASRAPGLAAQAESLADLPRLASRIESVLEPSGRLADGASPALAQYRERARQLHRGIKERLDQLLADEHFQRKLRESYFTIRNDRYCVPVLAQFRAEVPGIVHNASQSGQTLFVEPQGLIASGNELAIAQSMVSEEEQRLLLELTAGVARVASELRRSAAAIARLDEVFAGAALAERLGAHRPGVLASGEPFTFEGLRHPLLALQLSPERVVPSDFGLSGPARALILSGPNAGGKTIAMTAVGLSAAMLRAGLPLAAGPETRMPLVDRIAVAMGDAQDMTKGLSSFSAHIAGLRDILAQAGPGSLVLIDEMASDTDPREGSALGIAVLEDLLSRGALVVATTHLDPLKALAFGDARFANAAVGFDATALAPTYRVVMGQAGRSSALEIARRSGLPDAVIERARSHLDSATGPLGAALAALEAEEARWSELRKVCEDQRDLLAVESAALESRAATLLEREEALAAGAQRELLEELDRARAEVDQLLGRLRAQPGLEAGREARQVIERHRAERKSALDRLPSRAAALPPVPGQRVRSKTLELEGELLGVEGALGLVAMGSLKLRQPLADLIALPGAPPSPRGFPGNRKTRTSPRDGGTGEDDLSGRDRDCDLRGLRSEEALRAAESFLDRAYSQGIGEVRLIHGLGTGALKASLRKLLKTSAYVRSYRADDTRGDAATLVVLA